MARLFLAMFALTLALAPAASEAAQTRRTSGGRQQVVHDRIGPVIMHRALPPYWGLHVYKGR